MPTPRPRRRTRLRLRAEGIQLGHPAQFIVAAFALTILVGALLLCLPVATTTVDRAPFLTALFTSVSAVCVTGLVVVDTGEYWSGFGQVVILVLIQLGGLGITTFASLIAVLAFRRLGLRSSLIAQEETASDDLGDVRHLVARVTMMSLTIEAVGALVLSLTFLLRHDVAPGEAAWLGLFHAVSAFNNAGFSTYGDSLVRFQDDAVLLVTVAVLIILGGIGYPVLRNLRRSGVNHRHWTLHTKVTLLTTAALLVGGTVLFCLFEWGNSATLGPMSGGESVVNAWFQSVTTRTAGFNSIDQAALTEPSLLLSNVLMLIGGGSASAAGGIKVTTFAILGFVIWAELRGEPDVTLFDRRLPDSTQRQAVSVALLGVGSVMAGTLVLGVVSPFDLSQTLFETFSALGTVGLSTGITASLPDAAHIVLMALMFIGRLGPVTFGTALVLRRRERLYRFPEERPLIG